MEKWRKTKIGEFLFERKGNYKPDDEAIIELKRIDKIDFSGNFHIVQKSSKTNMILIKSGDLVISGINVAKGAMGIYRGSKDVTATIHYSSYTFDEAKIEVEYFKRFLKSAEFTKLLQEQVKGGIKTEIKSKHILPLEILLPCIQEQRDIVENFKSIETEDSELKQELTHQQTLLKKLRQQILQEAIEGKLTTDWRKQNPDAEPASELLARICAEKAQLIKDKKIKNQKPLPPISKKERPFDLPEGWAWCRLGEIVQINPRNKAYDDLPVSFVPMKLIEDGFRNKHRSEIKKWLDVKSSFTHFAENDIVFAKITPCFQNRKSCVVRNLKNKLGAGTTELFVLRNYSDTLAPEFILNTIKTNDFIEKGVKTYKGTVGQQRIQKEFFENYVILLPPLSEQKAIVTKVEKLLALCDQLETQITSNQTHAEQLMQTVLKEAFTQNSNPPAKAATNV